MQSLTNTQLSELLRDTRGTIRDLDRIECRGSLSSFIKRGWSQIEPSTPYKHGWHMDAICEHLEAVSKGQITRLLINVPPGTSKSLSTSVFFPAWEWGPSGRPGLRYIGTSYSERYAKRDNGRTRNLITSEWYQERWGDKVNLTKLGEMKIENTRYGFREAIPFKSLTAGRADRLIIDDPHSTESAESDTERETTIRVFLESVPTRLNDPEKSAIIIIMQRLHEEDVSGVALANDLGYTHLNLPMEYDPSRHCVTYRDDGSFLFEDPRTKDGELLFPDRFPKKVVEGYKSTMGPYAYAGQMQQIPRPRGGGIFQHDWWQLWGDEDDPENPIFKRFPACEYVVASLDTAYTEKTENDFSALTIWGVFTDPVPIVSRPDVPRTILNSSGRRKIILMNAWKKRLPLHGPDVEREDWETDAQYMKRAQDSWGLVEWVRHTCNRFRVDRLLIESKASGISVAQEIRRLNREDTWGVQLIDPGKQDKVARAYSVQHLFSDHMIYAPRRDWSDMVKDEMASFPKSSHDDITDTATQALRYLRNIGLAQHGHEVDAEMHEALMRNPTPPRPLYPT